VLKLFFARRFLFILYLYEWLMISNQRAWLTLSMSALTFFFVTAQFSQAATITQLATSVDKTDFQALGIGKAGYWFPQFDAGSPVTERPTDENMQFSPPSWAGFQFDSAQSDRTFSLDAGCFSGNIVGVCNTGPTDPLVFGVYSEGGDTDWDTFTLPDGTTGLSGAVVDEHTESNTNNSFNRISLNAGTPASFVLHIVVDNTDGDHNPAGRLRVRGANGNSGSPDLDSVQLNSGDMTYNGTTDVYSFRYDDFVATDFIKIQLNSGTVGKYASVAGIMFDVVPEPSSMALILLGAASFGIFRRRI
jgi:hypothetical protein